MTDFRWFLNLEKESKMEIAMPALAASRHTKVFATNTDQNLHKKIFLNFYPISFFGHKFWTWNVREPIKGSKD